MKKDQKITLTIKNPEATIFQGEIYALSSFNTKGKFDILPFHTHFISLIKDNITIYESLDRPKDIPIKSGVLRATDNMVHIFLGVESLVE